MLRMRFFSKYPSAIYKLPIYKPKTDSTARTYHTLSRNRMQQHEVVFISCHKQYVFSPAGTKTNIDERKPFNTI